MADASREQWEQYRAFAREVFGFDPGPYSEHDDRVQVDERRARKESRALRSTLSAELAKAYGVPVDEIQDGESVDALQIGTPQGLFIPWAALREDEERRQS